MHPASSRLPQVETFTQLKEKRKLKTKNNIDDKIKNWEQAHPTVYINDDVNNLSKTIPKYSSMKQIKDDLHKKARSNCGLKAIEDDVKMYHKDPSLEYIYSPNHKTRKDLKEVIKQENMEQSKKLSQIHHKDEISRLKEREDEIFAQLYSNESRLTYNKLKEIRRKENLDYNMHTFSKQTIGVHGHELPKFAENEEVKEYWKHREGYKENPDVNSHAVFKEKLKYWKKSEELLVNEHQDNIPNPDAFSKVKVLKQNKDDLIIKVNNLNHFKGFDPDNPEPIDIEEAHKKHIYRYSLI